MGDPAQLLSQGRDQLPQDCALILAQATRRCTLYAANRYKIAKGALTTAPLHADFPCQAFTATIRGYESVCG
ncbi:MAG: hypothetical protein CUN49_08555 [Candidatus Thermofonsia Clade 1 bacterium]|uniref:Uncharacterized protein n=1 Tax=Candidatus Thermofonsia Clade 1 bacterium TaxID=2364210 RepID=A0A2M8PE62_9CHLR|nr:MAG: hypothetical protein CUN49_08555 [Candidatus Thermofonsia Clade 1 bacterium]RMF50345.1 MAG: hypothetical protein D6749_10860 [Chloroflexota bacterium]